MSIIRRNLTYANAMATLAVFIALGGTALGAVIITNNSQVASNTISGHHPPNGKHANIIGGSINGQDVQHLVFHTLTLKNGWAGNCFGTDSAPAIARSIEGVVYFRGTMCRNTGSSFKPFAVPAGFKPTKEEWVSVDETGGATGRILIEPTGNVTVYDDPGLANASVTFTSLDGASYTLPY